ncbi:MAG TPA: YggS family pyridoxal phosphate-dependent enzyme [Gemmataceae bacterium]|nr:YggS family pyridoxal phosphate-dependent enzyme [Gemmataceae bacterium]
MIDSERSKRLANRLAQVEARIEAACRRAGRARAEVTLVAVTKTVSSEVAGLLPELGVIDLGESRPQELWKKAADLPSTIRWHLIGHLQRNKAERTLPLVQLIHSVDSMRLLETLEQEAAKRQKSIPVLLEVNLSHEASKHGFEANEVPGLAGRIVELQHARVTGLMTMAAWEPDPEKCRPTFAALRALRDRLRAELGTESVMHQLSMGMTNDFEVAIEEGATLVRIGTALFEEEGE